LLSPFDCKSPDACSSDKYGLKKRQCENIIRDSSAHWSSPREKLSKSCSALLSPELDPLSTGPGATLLSDPISLKGSSSFSTETGKPVILDEGGERSYILFASMEVPESVMASFKISIPSIVSEGTDDTSRIGAVECSASTLSIR